MQKSKKTYIVEQYVGLRHLHEGAYQARFTTIVKNIWDTMRRQIAFNLFRGSQLFVTAAKGGICTEIEKGHTEIPGGVE